jgi:hypothetical protein
MKLALRLGTPTTATTRSSVPISVERSFLLLPSNRPANGRSGSFSREASSTSVPSGEPPGIRTRNQGIKSPTHSHANRGILNRYGPPVRVNTRPSVVVWVVGCQLATRRRGCSRGARTGGAEHRGGDESAPPWWSRPRGARDRGSHRRSSRPVYARPPQRSGHAAGASG